jgi:drug/metabolite transporter (DMT)-like permease
MAAGTDAGRGREVAAGLEGKIASVSASRTRVHLTLVVVQLLFASLAIVGRIVLPHFPPGALVCLRVFGAAAILLVVNAVGGGLWVRDRRDLLRLAVLGLLGIAANQTLFLYGLRHTTAVNATILVTTVPVFTVFGSVLLGREPASPLKFAGVGFAALGTVYLIGPDRISLAPEVALGNALIVLGMICYAAYFIYSKSVVGRYGPITVSFYVMLFAAVGVLPFGINALKDARVAAMDSALWWWVGYIVVFPTILTYLLNIWALQRVSSNTVAVYIYLQPLFAAAIAPLVLKGEGITPRAALAGLSICAGMALVLLAERRQHRQIPLEPVGE